MHLAYLLDPFFGTNHTKSKSRRNREHTNARTHTHTHTNAHIHIHTHLHTHAYTHTHIHKKDAANRQSYVRPSSRAKTTIIFFHQFNFHLLYDVVVNPAFHLRYGTTYFFSN